MFSWYTFSYDTNKNSKTSLFWVFRKNSCETLVCMIFCKICDVAFMINRAGKLIFLHACLYKCHCTGLFEKPGWYELTRSWTDKIMKWSFWQEVFEYHLYESSLFSDNQNWSIWNSNIKYITDSNLFSGSIF